ncbi:MAG: ornithine carbamoyltransferase [Victivallales bacterium]|nr:ornithine carbamoyltransferase [Victivallales bacterium]MCF7889554.1 ornithine carbamoyltransferase [Victivallales bacterium]
MAVNLKGRSFLTLNDFTPEEIQYLLQLSKDLKAKKRMGIKGTALERKNIVLLFDKSSTRTRCAFETAAYEEGANVTYLTNSQFQVKESLEDSAKVLGRYYDGIEYRGFKQEVVEKLAQFSGVPVWNGLTDVDHPTQVLADFLTLQEKIPHKPLSNIKLVFTGDSRNNMAYALMYGAAKLGMHFVALGPEELSPDPEIMDNIQKYAEKTGAKIEYTDNVDIAVNKADAIYTDVWVSMGEDVDYAERAKLLEPYRVTAKMIQKTQNDNVLFMHCLPSYHDFETENAKKMKDQGIDIREVTDEIFRSRHSVVFDEAENRLHTIKAVMVATIS